MIKLNSIKPNPNNPRVIKDSKFEKLVKSIEEFPEMMEKRPMVCVTDVDYKIFPLGGNMRLRAIQELGYKEIPKSWVMMADDWTEEKRKEFVIKDNIGYGEWDWEELANEWDAEELQEWGLDIPQWGYEEDFDTEGTTTSSLDYLKFANYSIPISENEKEELSELVEDYIEENSVPNGFVTKIIECLKQ